MRVSFSWTGAILLAAISGSAHANPPGAADFVTQRDFCGTVVKVAESDCIAVQPTTPEETEYDITGTKPAPKIGDLIAGSGEPAKAGGICMESPHLKAVTWKKVAACPKAK